MFTIPKQRPIFVTEPKVILAISGPERWVDRDSIETGLYKALGQVYPLEQLLSPNFSFWRATLRHGGTPGATLAAAEMAGEWGMTVEAIPRRPDLDDDSTHQVMQRRNRYMVNRKPRPDVCVAWPPRRGKSPTLDHCVDLVEKAGIPLVICESRVPVRA